MKLKKFASLLLASAMVMATLAGCGNNGGGNAVVTDNGNSGSGDVTVTDDGSAASGDTMVIEIYDEAANYQGVQEGWFGQERYFEIGLLQKQLGTGTFQKKF